MSSMVTACGFPDTEIAGCSTDELEIVRVAVS
jgi:hypothetical protein